MKKLIALSSVVLMLVLASCGGKATKQETTDTTNVPVEQPVDTNAVDTAAVQQ
ncbi:MAG TPA: hypothetical protein PLC81_02010 [Bacteroidales bacterium]|nr:hypothetical protein [Bacteroidales bacterium]